MGKKSDLIAQMNNSLKDAFGGTVKHYSKMTALRKKYNAVIKKMRITEDMQKFNDYKKEAEEILKEIKDLKKLKEMQKNLKNLTKI